MAIAPVVLHHSLRGDHVGLLSKGPLGVDLFFALSGFLITTRLLRERSETGRVDIKSFYVRRAARIFPLYYAVLGLYVLRAILFPPDGPPRAHFFASLPYFASYTTNWFVDFSAPHPIIFAFAWSLAAEEQFYALFPWTLRVRVGPLVAATSLLAFDRAAELGWLGALGATPQLVRIVSSLQAPICFGAILACALHHRASFCVVHRVMGARSAVLGVLSALVVVLLVPGVPLWATQIVLTLLVASVVLREDHVLSGVLTQRLVARLGAVSYGVYLMHVSVITACKRALPSAPWPVIFVLALAASAGLASLSHRFFEVPIMQRRARKSV